MSPKRRGRTGGPDLTGRQNDSESVPTAVAVYASTGLNRRGRLVRGTRRRSRHPRSWHGRRSELRRRSLLRATRAIPSEPSSFGLRRWRLCTRSGQSQDGRKAHNRPGRSCNRYLPALARTVVHDGDDLPGHLGNPARGGIRLGFASIRPSAAGRVDRERLAPSSSHDVALWSVASFSLSHSGAGGSIGGGGRSSRRVAGSDIVMDMVPSLVRGAAHGLFASGPAECLLRVSHVESDVGRSTASVCASVSWWIALVKSRI
jgi:hypothetical protein